MDSRLIPSGVTDVGPSTLAKSEKNTGFPIGSGMTGGSATPLPDSGDSSNTAFSLNDGDVVNFW